MDVRTRLVQVIRRPGEVRTPGSRIDGVRRVVVVRSDRLGDLVLSLPAVDAVRQTYPGARLALMVRSELAPLARMVGGIDEVLEVLRPPARLRRRFEAFRPDLVVCISRGVDVALAAARAGVRHRIGTGYRSFSALFTRRVLERRRSAGRHECEYALSFAHRAGATTDTTQFALSIPEPAARFAEEWLEAHDVDRPCVLLHPGSGGSCPGWPFPHYVELAARLLAEGLRPVFSVGPDEKEVGERLGAAPAEIRALPRHTAGLDRLAALLRTTTLVVSNSTGPLHLAAAVGTTTLGFYPPWPTCAVARWGPYAANGWALVADHEGAEAWSRGKRRRLGSTLMGAISPELAARCALDLFRGDPPRI